MKWIVALALTVTAATALAVPPRLETSDEVSSTGQYRLSWTSDDDSGVPIWRLEEASDPEFADAETIYVGPDRASARSGQPEGARFYRVRQQSGSWSETVRVEVRHHDLARALLFLGIGGLVFVATAGLIIAGHLSHRLKRETS